MKTLKLAALVGALVLAGTVSSAQSELDPDLMLTIEDLNKSLASNIALKDVKASTSDAKELDQLFSKVEVFFVEKGDAADAVELSRKSRTLSTDIVKAVEGGQFEAATNAATDLSRTCRTCHTFYKKS